MRKAKIKVPRGDREVVASPPFEDFVRFLRSEAGPTEGECPRCGGSWEELRRSATEEIRGRAIRFVETLGFEAESGGKAPVIMTGHQPEFFHPGVWIKNYLANALGRELGFTSINVIVDNDATKHLSIKVPALTDGRATMRNVRLGTFEAGLAYEEVRGEGLRLRDFANELGEALKGGPLEETVAPTLELMRGEAKRGGSLVEFMAGVRCRLERKLGFGNLELTVSDFSEGESFRRFASHVLAAPERFAECYNSALTGYRERNGIRNPNRPIPDLAMEKERLEAPFWVWREGRARERVFLKREGEKVCFSDPVSDAKLPGWEEGGCRKAEEAVRTLCDAGWKLRPRALTMTAFLRGFCSAGFVHGIGGGIYDEITDGFMESFFGLRPPVYWMVSATVLLPIRRMGVPREAVVEQRRLLRDFQYNPQRHAGDKAKAPEFRALAEKKLSLIERVPESREEAQERFEVFRRLNGRMLGLIEADFRKEERRMQQLEEGLRYDRVAADREYSFILYSAEEMKGFFKEALERMKKEPDKLWYAV